MRGNELYKSMIPFNLPPFAGAELEYIQSAVRSGKICGDGEYTRKCNQWLQSGTGAAKALLTTSCTHALEMAAILSRISEGDEVIMPSYTFVSTANAFVLRGAKIVFVDIRPDTMNIDETLIEAAVTGRTKAVVPVHYAGVSCEMDKIMDVARKYRLLVIEDAAQAVLSSYKGQALGAIGDFGCFSFHETKNYSMGEGGALLVRDRAYIRRAEIIREKGTNRSDFLRGKMDKYTWVDLGSSYLPSDVNAAFLWAQLEIADKINDRRLSLWERYDQGLSSLARRGRLTLPTVPEDCIHNAHMYYIKTRDIEERTRLINFLRDRGVTAAFHYVPLHSSPGGRVFGRFHGEDRHTTRESERLLRLPMYYSLEDSQVEYIIDRVNDFYMEG